MKNLLLPLVLLLAGLYAFGQKPASAMASAGKIVTPLAPSTAAHLPLQEPSSAVQISALIKNQEIFYLSALKKTSCKAI